MNEVKLENGQIILKCLHCGSIIKINKDKTYEVEPIEPVEPEAEPEPELKKDWMDEFFE